MERRISKGKSDLEILYARLDQVRISGHERLRAEASLARAEAFADLMVKITGAVKQLLKTLVLRPVRRFITSLG